MKIPPFAVDGRQFKTLTGLWNYLGKKHACQSVSGIGEDRVLKVYDASNAIVARYQLPAPQITDTERKLTLI